MKSKPIIRETEEGGYWAGVPAIPGCATQAESLEGGLQRHFMKPAGIDESELEIIPPYRRVFDAPPKMG